MLYHARRAGILLAVAIAAYALFPAAAAGSPLVNRWAVGAGEVLMLAGVLATFGVAVGFFRPQLYDSIRSWSLFSLLFLVVIAAAAATHALAPGQVEFVPVAFAAVILSLVFDPRISLVAAMTLAALVTLLIGGQAVGRGTDVLFVTLVGGAAASLSARTMLRRTQTYQYVLTVALAYAGATVALGLSESWSATELTESGSFGMLNAVLSVVFAVFLLPVAERLTGATSPLTLIEYGDLNRPLLKRLSLEAPGTFAHTIAIANLVEAACSAIGANGLLGRVGAYYHDIGKLSKPQYFVENQGGGRNPHDKLKAGTSAAIIKGHIREGLDLAEAERLPAAIAAFIPEHHGTAPITYFLERAKVREREGNSVPNAADFAYPGPIPQSAETAVCMLADGIEAAVRVLGEPTAARIREVVDHIVRQRIDQGQLKDAPLTLRQLETVKEQFVRVLLGMYHTRIEYPSTGGGVSAEFPAR